MQTAIQPDKTIRTSRTYLSAVLPQSRCCRRSVMLLDFTYNCDSHLTLHQIPFLTFDLHVCLKATASFSSPSAFLIIQQCFITEHW